MKDVENISVQSRKNEVAWGSVEPPKRPPSWDTRITEESGKKCFTPVA